MAEGSIFVLIAGFLIIGFFYLLGFQSIDPRVVIAFLFLLLVPGLYAAFTTGPFVPSSKKRHRAMLRLAEIGPEDIVYDLGCGDGRLVFHSAKLAKKATGYELSVPLYLFGKFRQLFNPKNAQIRYGNIWNQDYQDANVIFCYLLPGAMKQFHKQVWPTLKPGTRVISNAFPIHKLKHSKKEGKVFLYEV